MPTIELEGLSPQMREAVEFCQYWNLSKGLAEFLEVMGKEVSEENKTWASAKAVQFRKNGVNLRNLRFNLNDPEDWDYSTLQVIAEKSLASLGKRKDEADAVVTDIHVAQKEIFNILAELRKFKDRAVIYELAKSDPNAGY